MSASGIVLMSDRRIATIPVRERCELLLDARAHGLTVDDRKQDAAGAWAHVRRGVLTRLQQAQSLLPGGVQLLFIEGYRPRPGSAGTSRSTPTSSRAPIRTGRPPSSGKPPAASCRLRRSRRTLPAQPST